ncbi:MAG TPA: glycine--tRNA ligase [Aigarchaeota archaeon]|nr:glycine--tRNA ligase [Aigarchaeota archaeon]
MTKALLDKIVDLAVRRGIFFPTAEIYHGPAGFYDLGPLGSLMKHNIIQYWREFFILRETKINIYEIDGSIILPYTALKASGHVDKFTDPKTECRRCGRIYRADHLIEEVISISVEGKSLEEIEGVIAEHNIRCPSCGGELGEIKPHHLMFKTEIGAAGEVAFLRPETAQNIFLDFKRVYYSMRCKLPFGIAQVGRSYRNEISPRQSLFRLREFTQMEIEMFIAPEDLNTHPSFDEVRDVKIRILTREEQLKERPEVVEISAKDAVEEGVVPNQYMAYYLARETQFYMSLGIPFESIRFRHLLPEETPHYSGGNFDLEVRFSFGWKEIVGNAYRTDYDLSTHSRFSGEELAVQHNGRKVTPHVIEPSFGIERTLYALLEFSYSEDERGWPVLKLPRRVSPVKAAVLPLMRKDGLDEKAYSIYSSLRRVPNPCYVVYDDTGSIGRRYARSDEIGVNLCITIDYQTLEDDTVTVRDRDTKQQIRVKASELMDIITKDTLRPVIG